MEDSEGGIEWSYSNAMRYESCPRSLFYHYWHNQRDDTDDASESYTAEHVWYSTPGALIGTAVHAGISTQIQRWSQGKPTSRDESHEKAREVIETSEFPLTDERNDPETNQQSLIDTATDHLDHFLSVMWPQIRSGRYILHEEVRHFQIEDTSVWVQPDLCHRNSDGQFVVTDWKTRQPKFFEEHNLQLQAYALWARTEFEPDIENLRLQLGFTGTGEIRSLLVTENSLEATLDKIRSDIQRWSRPNNQSEFPTKPDPEKCQSCGYRSSCPTGQDIC